MNPSKLTHSPLENKTPSQKSKRPIQVDPLELTSLEDVNLDGEPIEPIDPNFQSELEYDGYPNIEDYDNHAYKLDPDGREDPEKELNFEDREEQPGTGEEDSIDPQENRS